MGWYHQVDGAGQVLERVGEVPDCGERVRATTEAASSSFPPSRKQSLSRDPPDPRPHPVSRNRSSVSTDETSARAATASTSGPVGGAESTEVQIGLKRLEDDSFLILASRGVDADSIFDLYRQRWEIETLFAALKSRGIDLEAI